MNLFFDTSALVKFFHEEGADIVTDLILDQNNGVWISELGRLEKTTWGFLFTQPDLICRAKKYRIIFDSEFILS